jgi:transposase-like protein
MASGSKIVKNIVWSEQQSHAAVMLAEGYAKSEVAREVDVHPSTITRWTQNEDFAEEVDRLSLIYGLASRAERMRQIKRAAREFERDGKLDVSGFTYLDLLKEARIQTEGVRLDILSILTANHEEEPAAIVAEARPVANLGSGNSTNVSETDETDTE